MKGKFFGLLFTDGLINVRILESVEEYRQEGSHMHHCVFGAGYNFEEELYLNEYFLFYQNGAKTMKVEREAGGLMTKGKVMSTMSVQSGSSGVQMGIEGPQKIWLDFARISKFSRTFAEISTR